VLCVDEKSQIQALDRTAPILPLRAGLPEKATHDYRRHGTTTLFAALEIATGQVTDACYDRHGKAEFLDFMKKVARAYPRRQLHVVVDNYHTHKHPEVQAWLAKNPRCSSASSPAKPSDAEPSPASNTSSPRSAASSTAGTIAATHSPGPRPPTRSCPTPVNELQRRDTSVLRQ
jgi:hypothetical protein